MKDRLVFDFSKKDTIFNYVKVQTNTKEWKERVKKADTLFDTISFVMFLFHLFLSFPCLQYELLPAWLWVVLVCATRTGLAGVGHYHCHRTKDGITDWGYSFFDI